MYSSFVGGYVVKSIMTGLVINRARNYFDGLLDPVMERITIPATSTTRWDFGFVRILEENLPAAIAILRFNGIEVEVEK